MLAGQCRKLTGFRPCTRENCAVRCWVCFSHESIFNLCHLQTVNYTGNPATSSAGPSTATTGNSSSDPAVAAANDQPVTFAAAPERDPYINKVEPGAEGVASWQGKFEEELAREERELFGGVGRGHGKSGGRKP